MNYPYISGKLEPGKGVGPVRTNKIVCILYYILFTLISFYTFEAGKSDSFMAPAKHKNKESM